jgi:short-subunit dehydrogenase
MSSASVLHWRKLLFWKYPRQWKDNSVIVITGASSGIGRELALQYSRRKCRLVLAARTELALKQVVLQCRANGSEAVAVPTDVTSELACRKLMESAVNTFGCIDILVLDAGVGCHNVFSSTTSTDVYRETMQVNFFGYLHCTMAALPHLFKSKGQIVVVSSLSGEMGLPYRTAYCASKFAITGFFEALRAELVANGEDLVHITLVCPPTVNTKLREHALTPRAQLGSATSTSISTSTSTSGSLTPPITSPAKAMSTSSTSTASPVPAEHQKDAISAEACAEVIIEAADRRFRKVYFPLKAYLGIYVRPFFPDIVDVFATQQAKL